MIGAQLASASVVLLAYGVLCGLVYWRYRRQQRAADASLPEVTTAARPEDVWWVCHASQTGQAQTYARLTAQSLHHAGLPVRCLPLGQLSASDLASIFKLFCAVSTYGEGDPPDSATPFASVMQSSDEVSLAHMRIGVLALGDRSYKHYCGFGRELSDWFVARGAQPWFDCVDVDRGEAAALSRWRELLGQATQIQPLPDWDEPALQSWRLRARTHLNLGSQGEPVHHLELVPADASAGLPTWAAGDLVQIEVPHAHGLLRDYSIASIPQDGAVHLLVRRARHPDGTPGLASGWLTEKLAVGGEVKLRLRDHLAFRIHENGSRPLILIGNGTGLAGLRAHLRARLVAAGCLDGLPTNEVDIAPSWLIFGEREASCDAHYRDELQRWQASGWLTRLDWVFSREGGAVRYVQHRLRAQAEQVSDWVVQGAAIYVCGSLQGMATEVDHALREIVGETTMASLIAQGRYRRDVY